jgi:hypothetical protein
MKKTLIINIHSLLYNNDPEALKILKDIGKYNDYKKYDKDVEPKIVNKIKLEIYTDDTIEYIKKKLSLELFEKIKENNKGKCFYCFDNKNNEIIDVSSKKDISYEKENDESDDLGDLSDIEDIDYEDIENFEELDDILEGGGKNMKIMICHNCCKCYMMRNYFSGTNYEKFNDIYPFPEIIHLSTENNILGYDFRDGRNDKKINLELNNNNISNPYNHISKVNNEFLKDKKNKLTNYLNEMEKGEGKNTYLKNESFNLYNNYDIKEDILDFYYLPELCLYNKKNRINSLIIYTKIYFPYIDYKNYNDKFILKKEVQEDKYKIEELIEKDGWGDKFETYEKLFKSFNKIKNNEIKNYYTSKISYSINDTKNINTSLNFEKIPHLIELNENIPFMSMYLPEETVILEKIWKEKEKEIKQKDWKIFNKNMINFRILLPKEIIKNHYFQVNLYPNMQMDINISFPTDIKIFIQDKELDLIHNKVIDLIKKLNDLNIFNISDGKIPIIKRKDIHINSMNFYLQKKSKISSDEIITTLWNKLDCMKYYFIKDANITNTNYRYQRINNVKNSDIIDYFLFYNTRELITKYEDNKKIKIEQIESIKNYFGKKHEESKLIVENFNMRYINVNKIKFPPKAGLYFNIKNLISEDKLSSKDSNYKIDVLGLRSFNDWGKIKEFLEKLFYFTESQILNKKDENIKEVTDICNLDTDIKNIEKTIVQKDTYLAYQNEKLEINIRLQETKNKELIKKLKKRKKELEKIIKDEKKKIKRINNKQVTSYLKRLYSSFPNLKASCAECGTYSKSNECIRCDIPLVNTNYAKVCQKRRQPMGTSMDNEIEPEIIPFDEDYETQRFKEFENIQIGGDFQINDLNKNQKNILIRKNKKGDIVQSTLKYKDKALSCPNFDNDKNDSLVRFLDIDKNNKAIKKLQENNKDQKIRDLFCQPCCFIPKQDKKGNLILDKKDIRNIKFCKGLINWSQYLNEMETDKKNANYISTNNQINNKNEYGQLPLLLHNIFNNFTNLYNLRNKKSEKNILFQKFSTQNILTSPGFILKGIEQKNKPIISMFEEILDISNILQKIKTILLSNELLFNSLNGGKIKIKFKNINNYIKYLNGNNVEMRWIYDIISTKNLFEKYKEGLNIIIFKQYLNENNDIDIKIIDYEDILYEDYYNINKTHIFLYEYPNRMYEPIILKYPGETKRETSFSLKRQNKDLYNQKNEFLNFIKEWINILFKTNILTINKIKERINTQIIDVFNKVLFIESNKFLIPLVPQKYSLDYKIKKMISLNDIKEYLHSYKETKDYINNFSKEINDDNYQFAKIILDKNNKNIVGIQLANDLIIPIIEEEYKDQDGNISNDKLFYEINNTLFKQKVPKEHPDFIKEKYDFEIYERMQLEFSNRLTENIKNKLKDLLQKKDYINIKKELAEIYNKLFVFKLEDQINYYNINKKDMNFRDVCSPKNIYCDKDSSKLIIPYHKKNLFLGLLTENFIYNDQVREKLLNNKINRIIDIKSFIDDENHIFRKREADF